MDNFVLTVDETFERLASAGIHPIGKFRDAHPCNELMGRTPHVTSYELATLECGVCIEGLTSVPMFAARPSVWEFGPRTDRLQRKYLEYKIAPVCIHGEIVGKQLVPARIRWEHIHGKNRKRLRHLLKLARQQYLAFVNADNRYAGRDDVVRIYTSVIGGPDLNACRKESWFLDMAEDPFYSSWDRKYVYIWAKIEPGLLEPSVNKEGEMI